MQINLVIIQPTGYVHSLCFLDTARYLRHHLRAHGIEAHITKNRPAPDRVNIVFGAHLGIPDDWDPAWCCVWFNQEQVGAGGADLSMQYLQRLATGHVIDYDKANLMAYLPGDDGLVGAPSALKPHGGTRASPMRAVMPLRDAPFMRSLYPFVPLNERPIDLLFFGSLNDYRIRLIERIQRCGVEVARFDQPMYGPERDAYIAQAKAVLNLPFYGTNRFEQVRVFNALSIGTPVVSLRRRDLVVDPGYEHAVQWFEDLQLEPFFSLEFLSQPWYGSAMAQLMAWQRQPTDDAMASLAEQLVALESQRRHATHRSSPWVAPRLNLDGARTYRTGWLNVTLEPNAGGQPDAEMDLERLHVGAGPVEVCTKSRAVLLLPEGLEAVVATHDAGDLPGLRRLLSICQQLLAVDGVMVLDCPLGVHDQANGSPANAQQQALARLRGLMDDHLQFEPGQGILQWERLDWGQESAASGTGVRLTARLTLRKRHCTPREALLRRCAQPDFGAFPEDDAVASAASAQPASAFASA